MKAGKYWKILLKNLGFLLTIAALNIKLVVPTGVAASVQKFLRRNP
jgi:hypothetical protein